MFSESSRTLLNSKLSVKFFDEIYFFIVESCPWCNLICWKRGNIRNIYSMSKRWKLLQKGKSFHFLKSLTKLMCVDHLLVIEDVMISNLAPNRTKIVHTADISDTLH